jgi:EAL domain-containing protein (putative c-di-GMP-specific phosphodiesterase class I)
MKDHKKSIITMMELKKIGIELYLDDFGTGYSSLQYLKRLPINVIKIDRSFIKDIGIDENNEAIVEAILLMANSLKKNCIAEGVETKEQLHFMVEHGCYLIQGYLFSKPLPGEYIAELLEQKLDLL